MGGGVAIQLKGTMAPVHAVRTATYGAREEAQRSVSTKLVASIADGARFKMMSPVALWAHAE